MNPVDGPYNTSFMMDDMMTLYKRLFLASHKHFQNLLIDLGKMGSLRQYSQHMAQPEAHQPQTLSVYTHLLT